MHAILRRQIVALVILLLGTPLTHAEAADFLTAVGTVDRFENETLRIIAAEKSKKGVELKVTGTSNFYLLSPQMRSGKTVITQRSATASDLTAGQSIAVIYTVADKENVLLVAVIKPIEKK